MAGPIFIGALTVIARVVIIFVKKTEAKEVINLSVFQGAFMGQLIPFIVLFTTTIYPLLVSTAASPLKCQSNGTRIVMTENPSSECFGHDWLSHLNWTLFFLFIYGVFFPGFLVWLLWRDRSQVGTPLFVEKFCHITVAYTDKYYWYEFVNVVKRASFVMLSTFLARIGSSVNLFCAICLNFGFLAVESSLQPYTNPVNCKKGITYAILFNSSYSDLFV
jgi:hypothetical protein